MLGFGGHWTTKSRRYSTTMGALRRARAAHTAATSGHTTTLGTDDDPDGDETVVVLREWSFRGAGWQQPAQAALAAAIAAYTREQRRTARAARLTA
jgi:hypothetical protein